MLSTTPASTACEQPDNSGIAAATLTNTIRQMLDGQIPNLLRLYLNPYVTQASYCLTQYIETIWPSQSELEKRQIFLSNSLEEALSGAVKLARYDANAIGRSPAGLVIDQNVRLTHFCSTSVDGQTLSFLPEIKVCHRIDEAAEYLRQNGDQVGFVVDFLSNWIQPNYAPRESFEEMAVQSPQPLLILLTDQIQIGRVRDNQQACASSPDILVFDESFNQFRSPIRRVRRDDPAISALDSPWNGNISLDNLSTEYHQQSASDELLTLNGSRV